MTKLSIIVPVYNVEKYLPKCLESLIKQTLKDIEIICVNDGSMDNSLAILKEFASKDSRIRIIDNQHQGVAKTRNTGIEQSTGEYIGFVDSDDYIDIDFFEKLYNSATKSNSDIAIASILKHKNFFNIYNAKYTKEETAITIQDKIKLCEDKKHFFFYAWNKIYHSGFIKENNIKFSEGQIYEDVMFAIKALYYSNKIISVYGTKYHYIEHKNSLTKYKDKTGGKEQDLVKAYSELQEFCNSKNIEIPERLNYYTKENFGFILNLYKGKYQSKIQLFNIFTIATISNYSETRNLITILGFKIKIAKREIAKERQENVFYQYKKDKIDITKVPPAQGLLRDIQLANLALLKELAYVCEKNNFKYILDAGTLLGAMRHSRFIPWDDDIDILMFREDYEKIVSAFKNTTRNSDIYAEYHRDKDTNSQYFIKIKHKKCPFLGVDIFPLDSYGKHLSLKEQLIETNKICKILKHLKKEINQNISNKETKTILTKTMKEKILLSSANENGDFVYGVDFAHKLKNWFLDRDIVLPLRKIQFEDSKYTTVNKPKEFLKNIYGDYMKYPKKMKILHYSYKNLTSEQLEAIKKLGEKV
ncbi:MAG TPA: hypothetical protein DCS44_03575 [Cyanobacteria bacterium UBA10660]|nr:MAG TPA: hypothetical protein CPT83_08585 [Candidatus Gastranaerophilales bacterium HUM_1]HAS93683.1 hypothetical protein [Cyanobacteria bacterium UBA10660]